MNEQWESGENTGPAAGDPNPAGLENPALETTGLETGATAAAPEASPRAAAAPPATVPVHVVQSMREELNAAKLQNQLYQASLRALQPGGGPAANTPGQAAPARAGSPASMPGLAPLPTDRGGLHQRVEQLNRQMAHMQFVAKNPDFKETINTYLPEMIQKSPGLLEAVMQSPRPLALALELARTNPAFTNAAQAAGQPRETEMDRVFRNLEKPGSASQEGGSAPLTAAEHLQSMSDEEFAALVEKVKAKA